MKRNIGKSLQWYLIFGMVVWLSIRLSMAVSAANVSDSLTDDNSPENAVAIVLGDVINGSITETDDIDYFQFELGAQGCVSFKMTSYMRYYDIGLLDASGVEIWYTRDNSWVESVGFRTDVYNIYLEAGKYYFEVDGDGRNGSPKTTGTYTLETGFVSSATTNQESDNTTASANELVLGGSASGQISINDNLDYYKFHVPSDGKLTLDMTSYMRYYVIILFDQDGKQIWYTDYNEWTATVGYRNDVYNLYLEPGAYFMQINGYRYGQYNKSTGKYVIKTGFLSTGSSFQGDDNSIAAAHPIAFDQTYVGQISIADNFDTYQFTVGSETFLIDVVSYMQYYCVKIFDRDGKEVWYTDYNEWNSNVGYRKDTHELTLSAGTYALQVNGYRNGTYDKSTGKYEFKISRPVAPSPTPTPTPTPSPQPNTGENNQAAKPTTKPTTTGKLRMSSSSIVLKKGQVTSALKVTKMPAGDHVASVIPKNKKIVKVVSAKANGAIKLKALKTGSTHITVTTAKGKKVSVKVKVQAKTVKTTGIKGVARGISIKKGQTYTLKPQVTPITSQQKVTYRSQNKNVATVTSKGKIKAKKKGTTTVLIKSGGKQVKCKVTVR